jgi:hypothetical protein
MGSVLLDANLIVLLVVGSTDEGAVLKHKRTRAYTINDFRLLVKIVSSYTDVATIPNALSEVSNLLSFEHDQLSRRIVATFSRFVANTREHYVPSRAASDRAEFAWLGLTDSALLEVSASEIDLLTADVGLHIAASKAGYRSTNFTHLTEAAAL